MTTRKTIEDQITLLQGQISNIVAQRCRLRDAEDQVQSQIQMLNGMLQQLPEENV